MYNMYCYILFTELKKGETFKKKVKEVKDEYFTFFFLVNL